MSSHHHTEAATYLEASTLNMKDAFLHACRCTSGVENVRIGREKVWGPKTLAKKIVSDQAHTVKEEKLKRADD